MDSLSSPNKSSHNIDSDDGDDREHLAPIEDGQSQDDVFHNVRETRDRRRDFLRDLSEGEYRPYRLRTSVFDDPEHILREARARNIKLGTAWYFKAWTPTSPRSLCGDSETYWSREPSGDKGSHAASVIGLLSSSPGTQLPSPSPSPSLDSDTSRSLASVDSEDERDRLNGERELCALCRQINVEVLAAGFTHYLLPDFFKSSYSCKLCSTLKLNISCIRKDPIYRTDHTRVKLSLREIQLWDEETGDQYCSR